MRPPLRPTVLCILLACTAALAGCGGGGSSTVTVTVADTGTTDTSRVDTTATGSTDTGVVETTGTDTAATDTGGDEPPDLTALDNPTTYDQAVAVFATATGVDAEAFFQTPGGDVYCDLGIDGVMTGCEFKRRLPAQDACQAGGDGPDDVGRIELTPSGVEPVCNSDTIIRPDAPVLDDRRVARVSGSPIQCMNVGGAVLCLDTQLRKGFWVDPTKYVIL